MDTTKSFRELMSKSAHPDQARREAIQRLLHLGLAGFGLGAAGRGLVGLLGEQREPLATPFVSPGPSVVPIPLPPRPAKEKAPGMADTRFKLAEAPLTKLADGVADMLAKHLPQDWLSNMASSPDKAWPMIPAAVGVGAGTFGAGWSLTDWLLNKRRKTDQTDKLEAARNDYRQALMAQQQAHQKVAGEEPYARLDDLYDLLEKRGMLGGDTANQGVGALVAAMLATGAGTGYGAYKWTKGRSNAALLRKALEARSRQLWQQSPQPIVAVPEEPAALGA